MVQRMLMISSGVNNRTPSVSSGGTTSGGYSPFPNPHSPTIPVAGLFFIHPDHLGSTTMITDGYGNPVSGGEYGGKSHISYKPYGEILRTDSGGPDITKFKYTGQVEDKESGLMYYKARYYDPMVARFTQADSVVRSDALSGMNLYMYVDGNPLRLSDITGHKPSRPLWGAMVGYLVGEQFGLTKEQGAMAGFAMHFGKKWNSEKNAFERSDLGNGKSDLARSDIGKITTQFGRFWRDFYRNPGDAIARSDYGRSDAGKLGTKYADFWKDFAKNPSRAIARSDLGRGDLGRAVTRNRECIYLVLAISTALFGSPAAAAIGELINFKEGTEMLYKAYSAMDAANNVANKQCITYNKIDIPEGNFFGR